MPEPGAPTRVTISQSSAVILNQHVQRAHLSNSSATSSPPNVIKEWSTYHAQAKNHRAPETDIVQQPLSPDPLCLLNHHNGQLAHLRQKSIPPNLLRNTSHHNLMADSTHQKHNQHCHLLANMRPTRRVNVSSQEMMDRDVPLARKLQPISAVPPIAVEQPISKTGEFGEGTENVFENYEENE